MEEEKCSHTKDTGHGILDSVNPYSGICLECGENVKLPKDCPVCGYYCLGNGGYGCIDKLGFYEKLKEKQQDMPQEFINVVNEHFWDLV